MDIDNLLTRLRERLEAGRARRRARVARTLAQKAADQVETVRAPTRRRKEK